MPGFFTPKALAYYLPAFMIFILEDPDEADVMVDAVPSSLTFPVAKSDGTMAKEIKYFDDSLNFSDEDKKNIAEDIKAWNTTAIPKRIKRFKEMVDQFSDEQKNCIASFLIYRSNNEHGYLSESKVALERYWSPYFVNEKR